MVYNAMKIAQYIINHTLDKGENISNLKLQKLLYYVQAAFLVKKGEPCFNESIINWRHGPVIEEVYHEYKNYSDRCIADYQKGYKELKVDSNYTITYEDIVFNEELIEEEDRDIINEVVDSLIKYDAWTLVSKTHQEKPWKDTDRYQKMEEKNILKYFKDNKDRIYGEF